MNTVEQAYRILRMELLYVTIYLAVGTLIGLGLQFRRGRGSFSLAGAFRYCVPKREWWTDSARLDFLFYLVVVVLIGASFGKYMEVRSSPWVKKQISDYLGSAGTVSYRGVWVEIVYTFFLAVAVDLGHNIQHRLFHRIPWLWEFHKVHHSSTSLNVFTSHRVHPFETFMKNVFEGVTAGAYVGLVACYLGYTPRMVSIMGIGSLILFRAVNNHFKHSHIWISFGPLSYVFISPAMHQIHHSVDPKHHDRNFSTLISIWDWVFGSLYVPAAKEKLTWGVPASEWGDKRYDTLVGSLFHPFVPGAALRRFSFLGGKRRGSLRGSVASLINS